MTESYDEPQMGAEERSLLSLQAGKLLDGEGVDVVAERRRPVRGIELTPGIAFRLCLNGDRFALGHPPRLFLFVENQSGKSTRWRKDSEKWEGVTLNLLCDGVNVAPTPHYQYYQWLFEKKRYRYYDTRRMDNDSEYVYCGRIEDAFGELKPAKYVLEVQVHPSVYLADVGEESVLDNQRLEFEVLNVKHKYWTNALGPSDLGKKQISLEWENNRIADKEVNIAREKVGLTPIDSLARAVDDIPVTTISNVVPRGTSPGAIRSNTSSNANSPTIETAVPQLDPRPSFPARLILITGSLGLLVVALFVWRRR